MTETEIPHVNGSRLISPAEADQALPEQRAPVDAPPPGVWRGPQQPQVRPLPEPARDTEPDDLGEDQADEAQDDDLGEPIDLLPLLPEAVRAPHRFAHRHARHVATGTRIYAARRRDARSTARHERMMRAAEANGDHATALEWETRAAAFRKERHTRRMALLRAPVYAAKGALYCAGIGGGALVTLGVALAVAEHNPAEAGVPLHVAFRVIWWTCRVVDVAWRPVLIAWPVAVLAGLWSLGRAHNPQLPAVYGEQDAGDGRELVPDESAILAALRNLGLAKFNAQVRAGWQPRWLTLPHLEGNGWRTQLLLPQGTNVEAINKVKNLLASNLMRKPIEVWATEPEDKPGVLDLWVANPGALSGAVPPWPLIKSGICDYFKTVPVGVSLRGEPITAPLFQKNYMIGGIMGTGKSSVTRCLLLGASLDPLVDIDVFVFATNADYDVFGKRLRTLVKGDDDEHMEAALKHLRRLRSEVTARGQLLEQYGELKVTRQLARRDKRLRPVVCVLDEVHELFGHKQYGEEAAELAIKVLKKARKCAITLIFVTVSPTATSIPKEITRNTSNRVAFAVGDHIANDGLLGTGKHKAGITATTLNPATSIGTAVTIGFTANPFDVVRFHYNTDEQAAAVLARAMKSFEGEQAAALDPAPEPVVDPIADIASILGDQPRMRTQEVLEQLRAMRPREYRDWDFRKLSAALRAAGAPPYMSSGKATVDAAKVRAALDGRAADEADDEPGDTDSDQ